MLLALLIDPADPVEGDFDGPQERRQKGALTAKHARHVPAERLNECDENCAEQKNLNPADDSHGGYALEWVCLGNWTIKESRYPARLSCDGQNRSGRSSA